MKKISFIFACILAWSASGLQAATYIWNDAGNHLWTNSANWLPAVKPTGADTAGFNENKVGPVLVDAPAAASFIYWTNKFGGQYNVTINPGATLAPTSAYVCYQAYTSSVVIGGGGTFQVGGSAASVFYVGYRLSGSLLTTPTDGRLTVSNALFHMNKLGSFAAGYCPDNNSHSTYGEVDLTNATIVTDSVQTNRFKVTDSMFIGSKLYAGGLLRLPPSVTNIEASIITLGPYGQGASTYGILDLGESPQLQTLVATNTLNVYRGRIVWSENGTVKTGMPANVSIRVGSPGSPGALTLGYTVGSPTEVRWGGFKGLEAYLSSLIVGRMSGGSGGNTSIGELDLQSTNTTRLVGSISDVAMNIPYVVIGGPDAGGDYNQQGILKLPRTVNSITANNMFLGGFGNSAANSEINLGSNSLLTAITVSNVLQIGCGNFRHTDVSGNVRTGFPVNVQLTVGVSPSQRGKLFVRKTNVSYGMVGLANGTQLNGIGKFQAYLDEVGVGMGTGNTAAASQYGILDLRSCTNLLLDVDGTMNIGGVGSKSGANGPTGHGFAYLPAGTASLGNLNVGGVRDSIYGEGELWLSNTVIVVTNTVIGQTGFVTNQINGRSSGLDSAGPTISLVASNATSANKFGRMFLNFQADPIDVSKSYWGLKVKGNEIPYVQGLTNSMNVTVIKSGLSPANQAKLGVYYNTSGDYTYLGLPASGFKGTLLIIQ